MHSVELEVGPAFGGTNLTVRGFTVREAISTPFEVEILAVSLADDLDLDALLGTQVTLRVRFPGQDDALRTRSWCGLVREAELAGAESTGLSAYALRVAPPLWFLGQRKNYRVFQHRSAPEVVGALLAEWGVPYASRLVEEHPKHEIRIQYDETDFAFLSRILEEAGISYFFDHGAGSTLVFIDAPQRSAPTRAPLPFVENATLAPLTEFVTAVTVTSRTSPGRRTTRDVDFRRRLDVPLLTTAFGGAPLESNLEQYDYAPGSFVVETTGAGDTPVADDKGAARADQQQGQRRSTRAFEAQRAHRKVVAFRSKEIELAPGDVVAISDHPRSDLGPDHPLLLTELHLVEATWAGPWAATFKAVPTDAPHRPRVATPRPRIANVQSAVVVGPPGSLVHVDEFGRVRVRFHWDREHGFDDDASCWVRVSQGWAGPGFGHLLLPRVGHEVLVGFIDGNPDQPVIVGRLFNQVAPTPVKLPDYATQSVWRSQSLPGGEGYNEIRFEDASGQELVNIQAQRNLTKLVKVDETEITGSNHVVRVGQSRDTQVGTVDSVVVGQQHSLSVANSQTGSQMTNQNISQTTGGATSSLSGGDSSLEADGDSSVNAGGNIGMQAGANVGMNAGANIAMNAGGDIAGSAGGNASLSAGAEVDITSGADTILKAGGNLGLEATGDITLKAGGSITIKATGPITIMGADVIVQGSPIKLN